METEGKLIQILPIQNIETAKGKMKKLEFVIETKAKFPKKICFALWNEKADGFKYKSGDELKVTFDLESRESKGRWFTEARAWKIEILGAAEKAIMSDNFENFTRKEELPQEPTELDDLPF